jgi:galactose mutarotase-like enzyme
MIELINEQARCEILPYRGAATGHWQINGKDILYVEPESFASSNMKFVGGNPVMFPIFSTLGLEGQSELHYNGQLIQLPQHGLARLSSEWRANQTKEHQVKLYLNDSEKTRSLFPFPFSLEQTYTLGANSLTLEQKVTNHGTSDLPFVIGFHPYFAVSDPKHCEMSGILPHRPCYFVSNHGPDNMDSHLPSTLPLGDEEVNHHFHQGHHTVTLKDRLVGRTITMERSPSYQCMTVWSEPHRPFVCIEPVTGRRGAMETREHLIRLAPNTSWSGSVRIRVDG